MSIYNCLTLRRNLLTGVSLFFAAINPTAAVHAQATASENPEPASAEQDNDKALGEIVVTAQRREEAASNVGISITAFSGQQLKALGMVDSTDIIRLAPGVFMSSDTGGQNRKFTVRGVAQNDFLDAVEAPIAIYVDDSYIAPQQGQVFGLFDLERVEVLKGPQGTLFGRNATGGLVHFITKKPQLGETSGSFDVLYGSNSNVRVEAGITAPLGDKVAIRISGLLDKHDPILKNAFQGANDLYDRDIQAGRLHLLFEPSENVRLRVTASGAKSVQSSGNYETRGIVPVFDGGGRWIDSVLASPTETRPGIGPGGASVPVFGVSARPRPGGDLFGYKEDVVGDFNVNMNYARARANRYTSWGLESALEIDLPGGMLFKSNTDYREFTKLASLDVDQSPIELFTYMADARTQTFSQEFNVSGSTDSTKWVAGVFYLNIKNSTLQGLPFASNGLLNGGATTPGLDFTTEVGLKTNSYSVYGQVDQKLTEKLSLVVGGRYIHERKDFNFAQNAYVNLDETRIENNVLAFPVQQPPGANPFARKFNQNLWAGKAQLEFRPQDGLLLYAGINRGAKAGNVNGPLADGSTVTADQLIYRPEVLWSYEGGFKLKTLGGALRVNGSVYYYDYNDYQVFTFVNVSGVVSNEQASIKGAELEVVANPFKGLTISLSGSYNDAKVKNLEFAPGLTKDVRPVYSPKYQATYLVRYEFPIGSGDLALQADGSYAGSRFSNLRNFTAHRLDPFFLQNFRVSWASGDKQWLLSAFVNNAFDKRYQIERFDLSTLCGCTNESFGLPRWFGASVRYSF
jgi:iron complex outermembrane recepter protein